MAMVVDQQQQQQEHQQPPQQIYKHYCRVCKKGFGCGRALGGHMRAHGINDDSSAGGGGGHAELDEDPSGCGTSEWDDKLNGGAGTGTKRMYALRTNPNRLKSCRICENCGKEFVSWKSFLEHGKCSSGEEGEDSMASSPRSDADDDVIGGGWSKGKRSRRAKVVAAGGNVVPLCPSSEEEDLANCLVMLSASRVEPMVIVETEESCASASKEEDRRQQGITFRAPAAMDKSKALVPPSPGVPRGMFECKACKKVFTSHQALGGHRASHKKVKGCFAAKLDEPDEPPPDDEAAAIAHENTGFTTSEMTAAGAGMSMAIVPFDNSAPLAVAPLKKKSRVHECSICHRVFSSGQALGGHKRCHWITSNLPDPSRKLLPMPEHPNLHHQLTLGPMLESSDPGLDLNLPAPDDDPTAAATRQNIGSPLRLEMPTAAIFLQQWVDHSSNNKSKETTGSNNNNNNSASSKEKNDDVSNMNMEDEVESKVKLAKLTDLKDINVGGEGSPWLRVGIGSSTNEGNDP